MPSLFLLSSHAPPSSLIDFPNSLSPNKIHCRIPLEGWTRRTIEVEGGGPAGGRRKREDGGPAYFREAQAPNAR
ncbi:hypothetical protein L2E82_49044 [Cichorium intybus]|uniref:Uncharacterized protein n=1 Tax=Cichorium intybus TaxID=13427 RepID=A0ACB8YZU3_CICIN|nr:hypothetical protein L2E82_49044 [Cichorium intybus]